MIAAPTPWAARATLSIVIDCASPAQQRHRGEDREADHDSTPAPEAVGQ